jgi:uncharacterized membrane protein YjgN (DUF898 family)
MSSNENLPFPVWAEIQFEGNATEYFKIWIVNVLLTIATLGIYSAWAKVRTESYFYGNTKINGSSFRYTADPVKILKGRILSIIVFALFWVLFNFYPDLVMWTLGAAIFTFPFVVVASTSFRLRNTVYRNIRFHFDVRLRDGYRALLIPLAIVFAFTAGLYWAFESSEFATQLESAEGSELKAEDMLSSIFILAILPFVPYLVYVLRRFVIDHMRYGSASGKFAAHGWDFYKIYLKSFLLAIGVMMSAGMLLGIAMSGADMGELANAENNPEELTEQMTGPIVAFMIAFYGLGFYLMGYFNSRLTNMTYNNTEIGPLFISSKLRGRKLGTLYLTNTIAALLSLGLLIPWVKIRMAKYKASRTEFLAKDMNAINAIEQSDRSAVGEEIGDMFDLDIGL